MRDFFISYSRHDVAVVRRLVDGLREQSKDAWLDTEGIEDADVFPEVIRDAIAKAPTFVSVISPEAVASRFFAMEITHARSRAQANTPRSTASRGRRPSRPRDP